MGRRAHRAEDAAQSLEERQRISQRLSVPGRALVAGPYLAFFAELAKPNMSATDFDVELQKIDQVIAELEPDALAVPINSEGATKYVYLLYQRASLAGDLAAFGKVEAALKQAIDEIGPAQDLYLLKANLDFKFHRLADVKLDLAAGRDLSGTTQGKVLRADLDFQEGRYDNARRGYEEAIRDDLTWDNLARLAYLKWKLGDTAGADQLYAEAEDELTAKEMSHYASIDMQ